MCLRCRWRQARSWTVEKAAQLIRNDVRPHRWVALELNKRAWGLFWAGGGLQRCREVLSERNSTTEACSALVPATPEALLRLMLDLEPQEPSAAGGQHRRAPARAATWTVVAWTSAAWLVVLAITVAGFQAALERQDRKLDLLLQRTGPEASVKP